MQVLIQILSLAVIAPLVPGRVELSDFFRYGTDKGDQTVSKNDDSSTSELTISRPFSFFGKPSSTLWVNTNGAISFAAVISKYTPSCTPVEQSYSMVSPFWADVDTRFYEPGLVYYRQTTDPTDLRKCTEEINRAFPSLPFRSATWAYIATWHRVTFFGAKIDARTPADGPQPENNFQMALASDGRHSFAIFYYNQVTWTTGTASDGDAIKGLGGEPARAGFDSGDGQHFYIIPNSCSADILRLPELSNVGSPGKFVFRIDTQQIIIPPTQTPVDGVCSNHGRCTCDSGYRGADCSIRNEGPEGTTRRPEARGRAWHCKAGACEKCDHLEGLCSWPYFTTQDYCRSNCRT